MTGIPSQRLNVNDPGMPVVTPGVDAPIFFGCSSSGNVGEVNVYSNIPDVIGELNQGPLPEALATYLSTPGAGGPVFGVRCNAGDTAAGKPATMARSGGTGTGTLSMTGTPNDGYLTRVAITKAGPNGTAEFSYSLDGGYTNTDAIVVPSAGNFPVPGTGVTLTFTGSFNVGDTFTGDCIAPHYTATDLAACIASVHALDIEFAFAVLTGECQTSAAGSLLSVAIASHTDAFFNEYRYVRAMSAAGRSSNAQAITDYANVAHARLLTTYGRCDVLSRKPIAGWAYPNRSIVDVVAARAGASVISADLGRVASGAIPGVIAISHNERKTEMMDAKRFTTMCTIQGKQGFYITQGRLMSPAGSDYKYWQHGRCMDAACDTAAKAQWPFLNDDVRCNGDGTIDGRDAARYEGPVRSSMKARLMDPNAASGTRGHVSAFDYAVVRTNDLLDSGSLQSNVSIRPRGYIKDITTQLGFAANVGG